MQTNTVQSEEHTANVNALNFIRVLSMVCLLIWVLNILNIFIINQSIMATAMLGAIAILLISYMVRFIIGFSHWYCKYVYLFLLVFMVAHLNTYMTYHATMSLLFPIIFCLQYQSRRVLIYVYIISAMATCASVIVGYHHGLIDANMALLTTSSLSEHTDMFLNGIDKINDDYGTLLLYYAFPRCVIIAAIVPLLNHITRKIQEITLAENKSKQKAALDGLSGLLNKTTFMSEAELIYNTTKVCPGAFIFIDMDNFKSLNDTLGHAVGDEAIKDVADKLKEVFRQDDLLGRFGGDEFVAFLKLIPINILRSRLEDLLEGMKHTYSNEESSVTVTASIGVVYFEEFPGIPFTKIMDMADNQVYKAKSGGRNRICVKELNVSSTWNYENNI